MEVYRRSGRALPSHLSRDKVQSFALSHQTSSVNPIQDSDEDRGGQMPRKRIALAVRILQRFFQSSSYSRCSKLKLENASVLDAERERSSAVVTWAKVNVRIAKTQDLTLRPVNS